jgi:hypothetical protein
MRQWEYMMVTVLEDPATISVAYAEEAGTRVGVLSYGHAIDGNDIMKAGSW